MKQKIKLPLPLQSFKIITLVCIALLFGCKDDDTTEPAVSDGSYSVTVGVFILKGSTYEDQNKDFVFETQEACQSWSRTASGDNHDDNPHDHFNAAKNTTYNSGTEIITWTEYGPELDQASIDATCNNGANGATKTANKTSYTADKNFFLKIKSVVEK